MFRYTNSPHTVSQVNAAGDAPEMKALQGGTGYYCNTKFQVQLQLQTVDLVSTDGTPGLGGPSGPTRVLLT